MGQAAGPRKPTATSAPGSAIIERLGQVTSHWTIAGALLLALGCGGGDSRPDATSGSDGAPADGALADGAPADARQPLVPVDDPELPPRGFYLGVIPWPATGQDLVAAHVQVAQYAEFYSAHADAPFYDAPQVYQDSYLAVIDNLIRGNGMFPIVTVNFFGKTNEVGYLVTPPDLPDATLSDPAWRQRYKEATLALVELARPRYLSIGNEVNFWYDQFGDSPEEPNGFHHYVTLYEELYDEVKAISPETEVFCVFERERVRDHAEADLGVLELFDPAKLDLLAFTSYPFAVQGINRASDIPDDYYTQIFDYVPEVPLSFTELAWPSLSAFDGEAGQVDFLTDMANRLTRDQGIDLELFSWLFLHDAPTVDPLDSGLLTTDDVARAVYGTWQALSAEGR